MAVVAAANSGFRGPVLIPRTGEPLGHVASTALLVGHVEGAPASVTLGQYDVLAGEVWIVPLAPHVAPPLFGR